MRRRFFQPQAAASDPTAITPMAAEMGLGSAERIPRDPASYGPAALPTPLHDETGPPEWAKAQEPSGPSSRESDDPALIPHACANEQAPAGIEKPAVMGAPEMVPPATSSIVAVQGPSPATHKGLVVIEEIPQGSIRLVPACWAGAGVFEIGSVRISTAPARALPAVMAGMQASKASERMNLCMREILMSAGVFGRPAQRRSVDLFGSFEDGVTRPVPDATGQRGILAVGAARPSRSRLTISGGGSLKLFSKEPRSVDPVTTFSPRRAAGLDRSTTPAAGLAKMNLFILEL
jgi:hypothetical protein